MLRRILIASAGAMALSVVAQAAEPLPPPPPPPPPPLWTGPYLGVNVGYGFGGDSNVNGFQIFPGEGSAPGDVFDDAAIARWNFSSNLRGVFGGGQLGYNYQFPGTVWVAGFETDFQGAGLTTAASSTAPFLFLSPPEATERLANAFFYHQRVNFFGTLRGRLGWSITPTFLLYGTGGLAYGEVRQTFSKTDFVLDDGESGILLGRNTLNRFQAGWTAGGGIEWAFLPNWSLKVEYLFVDLDKLTVPVFGFGPSNNISNNFFFGQNDASTRFHTIKAGLNYHFWTAPPPVVAKY
jgi:outer membrane immunogenic protein